MVFALLFRVWYTVHMTKESQKITEQQLEDIQSWIDNRKHLKLVKRTSPDKVTLEFFWMEDEPFKLRLENHSDAEIFLNTLELQRIDRLPKEDQYSQEEERNMLREQIDEVYEKLDDTRKRYEEQIKWLQENLEKEKAKTADLNNKYFS